MGIFGRRAARRRLRRATQESLSVPTFTASVDCTPWVVGDLWPTELPVSSTDAATVAGLLRRDLQRIADHANDDLRALGRAGLAHSARRAAEARVIAEARAFAMRRVDSTLRQLHQRTLPALGEHSPRRTGGLPAMPAGRVDMDTTQVIPAVKDAAPATDLDTTQVIAAVRDEPPAVHPAPVVSEESLRDTEDRQSEAEDNARHRQPSADA